MSLRHEEKASWRLLLTYDNLMIYNKGVMVDHDT